MAKADTEQESQYKQGKFSATEEKVLVDAVESYRKERGMTQENLEEIMFSKDKQHATTRIAFWALIYETLPSRKKISVQAHVKRIYHPWSGKGKWTLEEDAALTRAVDENGHNWQLISQMIGRRGLDCRDRWKNHLKDREKRNAGKWSKEEEDQLTNIVTRMTISKGKDMENNIFWTRVSEEMGGTRGRTQCRIKWLDSLSKRIQNKDEIKAKWGPRDAYILVHKVDSLDVADDTEIDWKTFPDPDWNFFSSHVISKRWLMMKRRVPNYMDKSHQEIVDYLKVEHADFVTMCNTSTT